MTKGGSGRGEEGGLRALGELHAAVDSDASRLAARLAGRLQCGRGCSACCRDDLTVFEVEAERIRRAHPHLLEHGHPHPPGACAFLADDGSCRIYEDRPYVCRTQGLPLRWFEPSPGTEATAPVVERRDICPLNDRGEPLETLVADDCWLLGPSEARLAEIAELHAAERRGSARDDVPEPPPPRRVALRRLFARRSSARGGTAPR